MSKKNRVHLRRCHVCGQVTESIGAPVTSCGSCGKAMAPFFYFDDLKTEPMADNGCQPPRLPGADSPVRGLTATW